VVAPRVLHNTSQAYILALVLAITGCASQHPYRTKLPSEASACPVDLQGDVPSPCERTAWERGATGYQLLYAEFDDQGLLHPRSEENSGDGAEQINRIDGILRTTLGSQSITLVVYVHGWKNNASSANSDVQQFRKLLSSLDLLESTMPDRHQVVGIFVGWRGLSATWEPFKEFSFWDRKNTANKVAVGSARELFSRLRAYEQMRNDEWDQRNLAASRAHPTVLRRPPVRMLIIGHSFGGQLVYNALSPYLMDSLASMPTDPGARIQRYGDMVVILNPAFEATRFLPLYDMARQRTYTHYQAPLFVSITSTADSATGFWFPIGRKLDTMFEHYSSDDERLSDRHTMGHLDTYITHELHWNPEASRSACPGWAPLTTGSDSAATTLDLQLESQAAEHFFEQYMSSGSPSVVLPHGPWRRVFCGDSELRFIGTSKGIDPNIPIWNVETYRHIIPSHTAIEGDILESFVRQLYADSISHPFVLQ
jgi:hypothetical protein